MGIRRPDHNKVQHRSLYDLNMTVRLLYPYRFGQRSCRSHIVRHQHRSFLQEDCFEGLRLLCTEPLFFWHRAVTIVRHHILPLTEDAVWSHLPKQTRYLRDQNHTRPYPRTLLSWICDTHKSQSRSPLWAHYCHACSINSYPNASTNLEQSRLV